MSKVLWRFRTLRAIWQLGIAVASVTTFGWWVLLPLALASIDIELETR